MYVSYPFICGLQIDTEVYLSETWMPAPTSASTIDVTVRTYCIYTINCYLQAYVTLNISPAHITSGTNTIRLRLERTL